MPSFYNWVLRLCLLVSFCILVLTIQTLWPGRGAGWIDIAGVSALGLAMLVVAAWSVGAWLDKS